MTSVAGHPLGAHSAAHKSTIFFKVFFLCVFLFYVLPACMSVYHVCAWCLWRSEEESDDLELEFQTVVSCHEGAGL